MSICISGRCRHCEMYWNNVSIYNREEYEKYGFICPACAGAGVLLSSDDNFICNKCHVVSSYNEAVWNKEGNRICLYCSPKSKIHKVCDYLEQFEPIESRFEILDL